MKTALRGLLAVLLAVPLSVVALGVTSTSAGAEANGVGATPALGWSSWSFIRHDPSAANIEATADAMAASGLKAAGYQYVNIDDFYYGCPGSQGPDVDQYGRWLTDAAKFPAGPGGQDGIAAVADYVHSKGLKFGIYVTPGISKQAVAKNTPIEGTSYHAADIATTTSERNYNCGGMVGIDYSKPGAQAFINSWANEFASWGVDYLKIDGVGTSDVPDIQAWSQALVATGRPIHLELSNSLAISAASTWAQLSNGWRTGGDVECYCGPNGSSYPLTTWSSVSSRFDQVANWQPYGGPGGFNDYDSIEVGNGSNDGLTPDERKAQLSLWSLAASPLILGTDLTHLDPADLALLENKSVIRVDQDAIDAARIVKTATTQIFTKTEKNGDAIVGLFNTGASTANITTSAAALTLPASDGYLLDDLWSHQVTETAGTITETVPSHGVALLRVHPSAHPGIAPPSTVVDVTGLGSFVAGTPAAATETFTNNGVAPVQLAQLSLAVPAGWTATPTGATRFATVAPGASVHTAFTVTAPPPTSLFETDPVTATVDYRWLLVTKQTAAITVPVTISPPVQAPYRTFSSATDAPAGFAESSQQLGITGAGADLYSGTDAYSTIYRPGAVATSSTIDAEVVSQANLTGYGKAGIIVRNDMTGSGSTPEGVILFASPTGGIQLEWANGGGTYINSVTPPNGTTPASLPVYLRLERTGMASYTGYYSFDGDGWYTVGTATVSGQADTQDAGVFVTSHATGSPATAVFSGFAVSDGATPPPPGPTPYEAEAAANTLAGGAVVSTCSGCSGGKKVGYVGSGGTLTFQGITVPSAGTYQVTIAYLDGSDTGRQVVVTPNAGSPNAGEAQTVSFTPTGSFDTVGTKTITLPLLAGANTIEFANPNAYAPDFDRIMVAAGPS